MRRAPRFGPYRILATEARSADGLVYRGFDYNYGPEVLLVSSHDDERSAAALLTRLDALAGSGSGVTPIRAERTARPVWVVLPPGATQTAVELIGLTEPPVQNWFAANWGWPHPYAKTLRQLFFRCLTTIVVAAVAV